MYISFDCILKSQKSQLGSEFKVLSYLQYGTSPSPMATQQSSRWPTKIKAGDQNKKVWVLKSYSTLSAKDFNPSFRVQFYKKI